MLTEKDTTQFGYNPIHLQIIGRKREREKERVVLVIMEKSGGDKSRFKIFNLGLI